VSADELPYCMLNHLEFVAATSQIIIFMPQILSQKQSAVSSICKVNQQP
jgi:hypothetical protein